MMYTVVWVAKAEQQLAQLWLDATTRNAITRAAHIVEAMLAVDPSAAGESRSTGRRILMMSPLVVDFEVQPDDRTVRVLQVRQIRKRNK